MASPTERERFVAAWCDLDQSTALLPADREAIAASRSVRAVIVDFARAEGADEEIYDACAALGRIIAEQGGSPTLAASTIDHACSALGTRDAPWIAPARATVVEGFTFALLEKAKLDTLRSWAFPRCVVLLPDAGIAIAAGHPSADPEDLSEWAAHVAKAAALKGVRRAFVAGAEPARRAVEEALEVVGIAIAGSAA